MRSRIRNASILTAAGMLAITTTAHHEGLRTRAYKDVIGVPTICFGETRGVKMGDVKTVEECKWMLGNRLVEFEENTLQNKKCVLNPEIIPDVSYVQFLSLAYNIGEGGFCKSSIARYLNGGDVASACRSMNKYVYAGGVVWKGLVTRREAEVKLCLGAL